MTDAKVITNEQLDQLRKVAKDGGVAETLLELENTLEETTDMVDELRVKLCEQQVETEELKQGPGIRTRPPAPTDRVTRRRVQFDDQIPSTSSSSASSSTPVVGRPHPDPPPPSVPEDIVNEPLLVEDPIPAEPVPPAVDERPPAGQAPAAMGPQPPPNAPRFFTRPNQRTFSRQRPKASYGDVLNVILKRHVTDSDAILVEQSSSSSD